MAYIKICQKMRYLRKNLLTTPKKSRILHSRGKHNAAKLNRPYGQRGNIMSRNTTTTTNATVNTTNANAKHRGRKATTTNATVNTNVKVVPAPVYDAATGRLTLTPCNSLEALQAQLSKAVELGFSGVNAKAAYLAGPSVFAPERPAGVTDAMLNAAENLAILIDAVRYTLASMGKGTGTSSLYNVLDGRTCHRVRCRKVATQLSNSKALAAFIDTFMGSLARPVGPLAICTSVHGVRFSADRRQWSVRAM